MSEFLPDIPDVEKKKDDMQHSWDMSCLDKHENLNLLLPV